MYTYMLTPLHAGGGNEQALPEGVSNDSAKPPQLHNKVTGWEVKLIMEVCNAVRDESGRLGVTRQPLVRDFVFVFSFVYFVYHDYCRRLTSHSACVGCCC